MTSFILNRAELVIEPHLKKEKAGFRKGCICFDIISALIIILEQNNEWQRTLNLYLCTSKRPSIH